MVWGQRLAVLLLRSLTLIDNNNCSGSLLTLNHSLSCLLSSHYQDSSTSSADDSDAKKETEEVEKVGNPDPRIVIFWICA